MTPTLQGIAQALLAAMFIYTNRDMWHEFKRLMESEYPDLAPVNKGHFWASRILFFSLVIYAGTFDRIIGWP